MPKACTTQALRNNYELLRKKAREKKCFKMSFENVKGTLARKNTQAFVYYCSAHNHGN